MTQKHAKFYYDSTPKPDKRTTKPKMKVKITLFIYFLIFFPLGFCHFWL